MFVLLLLVAVLAGAVVSISPCVLPVLPVVLTAGASDRGAGADADGRRVRRRPVLVVVGLVLSFSLTTLIGSLVLSALGLPQDLLRNIGIAVLVVIGLSLLVPQVATLLERPFARLGPRSARRPGNGLLLGLSLGLVYVPCAGPILAAVAVAGSTHHINWRTVLVAVAFGIGAGIPLLAFALAGDAVGRRVKALRENATELRMASGVLMLVVALALSFNITDVIQRHLPGYVSAIQNDTEGQKSITDQLHKLSGGGTNVTQKKDGSTTTMSGSLGPACMAEGPTLEDCGKAPDFTGIDGWLNTAGDKPLTLSALRGKVVLIDFWTYSCINCQRTLPHVEAWYRTYAKSGFVVVGVHTPEFAFEHVRSNVVSQAAALGVKYPIAIDNEYATWNAYSNEYWPAEYLIDANGYIRHVSFGEGGYDTTEGMIRQLLHDAHPGSSLANAPTVPTANLDDNSTQETYLGYKYGEGTEQLHLTSGFTLTHDKLTDYHFPSHLDPDGFALDGDWTSRPEYVQAGADAKLELSWSAHTAYLVLGGTGTVQVTVDGKYVKTVNVAGAPTLYTLYQQSGTTRHVFTLAMSPGVQAYDFTFG